MWDFVREHPELKTPYYLLDGERLLKNMERIKSVREKSGAKSVLALKCFSTWAVFPLMNQYMDGTTSSSLNEAQLGHEKFGKETHAYSVAWSEEEVREVRKFATKIIFNSVAQLDNFYDIAKGIPVGLRVNPGVSYSHHTLSDPARKYSRLGATDRKEIESVVGKISGVMFHVNCENDDFDAFSKILDAIGEKYGWLLEKLEWVTLGGGIYFTKDGYPLDKFCEKLKVFSEKHSIQVYLEPGESSITRAGYLVTKVLDIVHNEIDVAVVDAAANVHMPDLVTYQEQAKMELPVNGPDATYEYQIAGRTCLAGDIFGTYKFPATLRVGDLIPIADAAGYTIVQKTWFNGVPMPSIVIKRLDGRVEVVRTFNYSEYVSSLS
ncbi:carboxynorspermidine decarboxylase [Candidatus Parcubacteria bacterium]|nr:MAG: carboxynorspermidine decarboxylase [Candidatus Parcubacteria bacterium]